MGVPDDTRTITKASRTSILVSSVVSHLTTGEMLVWSTVVPEIMYPHVNAQSSKRDINNVNICDWPWPWPWP